MGTLGNSSAAPAAVTANYSQWLKRCCIYKYIYMSIYALLPEQICNIFMAPFLPQQIGFGWCCCYCRTHIVIYNYILHLASASSESRIRIAIFEPAHSKWMNVSKLVVHSRAKAIWREKRLLWFVRDKSAKNLNGKTETIRLRLLQLLIWLYVCTWKYRYLKY